MAVLHMQALSSPSRVSSVRRSPVSQPSVRPVVRVSSSRTQRAAPVRAVYGSSCGSSGWSPDAARRMFDAYAKAMGVRISCGPNGGFFTMGGPADARAMQELFKQWQKYVHAEAGPVNSAATSSNGEAAALPLDVTSDELKYVVYADVPGLSKADLSIKLSKDNVLTISGTRPTALPKQPQQQQDPEAAVPSASFLLRQRPSGSFERKWTLPEDADAAAISAKVSEGVLAVTVGKVVQQPQVEESQDIPWV